MGQLHACQFGCLVVKEFNFTTETDVTFKTSHTAAAGSQILHESIGRSPARSKAECHLESGK